MLVMYEGRAAVLVDYSQVAEKQQHEVVGEAALHTKQRRRATVVATVKCKTLVIQKESYDNAVDLFKTMQKRKSNAILTELMSMRTWNMYKIKAFSQ